MAAILKSYNKFVLRYPLIAMSLTTGTTMGLGNVISQTAIEKRTLKTIDWARVSRFAAFGYLFSGPFLRYWYYGLDKYFAGAKLKPVKMMITDQIIAAPLLNSVILLYLPLSSGKSMIEAKKRFHEVNFLVFISSISCHITAGFSNCNESKLLSMAGDPINELLFHPNTTSIFFLSFRSCSIQDKVIMFTVQVFMAFSTLFGDIYAKLKLTLRILVSMFASTLRKYNNFVLHYPLLSMALTTGTTMGLGSIISQTIIEQRGLLDLDWIRIFRFAAFGYVFSGPFVRYWYYALEKVFSNTRLKPIKMMFADQTIAAPLLNAAMIAYLPLVSGKSFDEVKLRFLLDFPTVMKANYAVWPLIQLTNFYFIPVHHRVLYANICAIIWSTFVAFVTK
ncbi:unnamed protein product [Adineta ricciae]|uniref:Mpv17-like protein n=2 Tax=Adineta ricciae TaxID=249248 RepID=A0A815PMD8_ADIRI|nr:unnamed protein product [Adineta ricciae]